MANEKKTPLGWFVLAFFVGMAIAAWGWDKNTSTIPTRTEGAVLMIVVGCAMIVGSLIGFFTVGNKK